MRRSLTGLLIAIGMVVGLTGCQGLTKVESSTQPGVALEGIGCDTAAESAGELFALDRITGESLARAIAAGLHGTGGNLQYVTVSARPGGQLVAQVSSDRGTVAVELSG